MKKLFGFLLAASMLFVLAACGAGQDADQADQGADGAIYIPVIALGFQHQYWQAVKMGADQAAEDYGVTITFEGPEAETMIDKQVDMMKTALSKNAAALCMAAIDPESIRTDLEAAKAKGLKVVGFDSGLGDMGDTHCSTDNLAAGALAAENTARLLGGEGKIGIVGHSQTMIDAIQRVDGFVDYLAENHPDIEIVDIQYGDGDHLKSADIAKSMLVAFPDLDAIYASNEGAAVGTYNGIKEINKIGEILIVGWDSSKALKDAVRAGEIAGAITQDPIGMGYKSVEAAVKLLNGEPVEDFIDTGAYWYDSTNMDEAHIAPLLYD